MPHNDATTTALPMAATTPTGSPNHTHAPAATSGASPSRNGDDTDVGTYRCAHTTSTCAVVPETIVQAAKNRPRRLIPSVPWATNVIGVIRIAAAERVPSMNTNGSI